MNENLDERRSTVPKYSDFCVPYSTILYHSENDSAVLIELVQQPTYTLLQRAVYLHM